MAIELPRLPPGMLRRSAVPAVAAAILAGAMWFAFAPALFEEEPPPPPPEPVAVEPEPELPAEPEEPPEPEGPLVLMARDSVNAGVLLLDRHLEWRELEGPVDLSRVVVEGVVDKDAVLGAITMRQLQRGSPITWDAILTPGNPGFISAALAPGKVAVSIEVDRATTNANVIYPGDRVDVILVGNAENDPRTAARTIVHNSRVLAVGSTVLSFGRYARTNLALGGGVEPVAPPAGSNYTVEVSPRDSERVAIAADRGRLTLAMLSIADGEQGRSGRPTRFDEVLPAEPPENPPTVRVLRGGSLGETIPVGPRFDSPSPVQAPAQAQEPTT